MPGFYVSNYEKNAKFEPEYVGADYIYNSSTIDGFSVQSLVLDKFTKDKLFYEDDEYVIVTDGVIFNSTQLCSGQNSFTEYIAKAFHNDKFFWKKFRGTYSGAIYDKNEKKWIFFVNQSGDRPLFCWHDSRNFIVSSSLFVLVQTLKLNNEELALDSIGVYNLLTYAHMQDNETLLCGVKRLGGGQSLTIDSLGKLTVEQWHKYDNLHLCAMSEDEIIEELDKRFRHAVDIQFRKDEEYGYKHLASLSSGLDARMCVWVARDLGYDITTCTFSQHGFLDETIAEQMSTYLRCTYLFNALDTGYFMKMFDKVIHMSYGLVTTSNIVHAMSMMENINLSKYGMLHTGQIGDVSVGSFCKKAQQEAPLPFYVTYSGYLASKNKDCSYIKYDNMEQWLIYTRGFRGAMGSHIAHYHYQEMHSPFCDVDFLEFCMSIPLKLRANHYIYKKWILKKYPDAAKFKWGATNEKISDSEYKQTFNKLRKKLIGKAQRMIHLKKDPSYAMTPYDFWYSSYSDIREYIDLYYLENIDNSHISASLRADMADLFTNGTLREKMMVLTVLSFVKNFIT